MKGKFTLTDDEFIEAIRTFIQNEKKIDASDATISFWDSDTKAELRGCVVVVDIDEVAQA
mgnify:CR=1 FL=1